MRMNTSPMNSDGAHAMATGMPPDAPATDHALIDRPNVLTITGLSKSSLLSIERSDPTFPKRVVISNRIVRWYRDEVKAWLAGRPRGIGHVERPAQLTSPGRPPQAGQARARRRTRDPQ